MRIIITGINQNGEQVSEALDLSGDKKTFYSSGCYDALTNGRQHLSFRVRRLGLWRRFVLRFFKKWPTVSGGIQVSGREHSRI